MSFTLHRGGYRVPMSTGVQSLLKQNNLLNWHSCNFWILASLSFKCFYFHFRQQGNWQPLFLLCGDRENYNSLAVKDVSGMDSVVSCNAIPWQPLKNPFFHPDLQKNCYLSTSSWCLLIGLWEQTLVAPNEQTDFTWTPSGRTFNITCNGLPCMWQERLHRNMYVYDLL